PPPPRWGWLRRWPPKQRPPGLRGSRGPPAPPSPLGAREEPAQLRANISESPGNTVFFARLAGPVARQDLWPGGDAHDGGGGGGNGPYPLWALRRRFAALDGGGAGGPRGPGRGGAGGDRVRGGGPGPLRHGPPGRGRAGARPAGRPLGGPPPGGAGGDGEQGLRVGPAGGQLGGAPHSDGRGGHGGGRGHGE